VVRKCNDVVLALEQATCFVLLAVHVMFWSVNSTVCKLCTAMGGWGVWALQVGTSPVFRMKDGA